MKKKKKKNTQPRRVALAADRAESPRGGGAAEVEPQPRIFSAKGAALWLALAGIVFLMLCLLENVKQEILTGA